MATLKELTDQIPGLDPALTIYTPPTFKPSICDPIVVTDMTPRSAKYCAPTTIPADVKAAALKAAMGDTQKLLNTLNFSAPNEFSNNIAPSGPFNDACTTAYIKALTDLINNDIIPKNNDSQNNVSKLSDYITSFWNSMMIYVYQYTIAYKLHIDGKMNDSDFGKVKSILPDNSASDNVSVSYKTNLSKLIQSIEASISSTNITSYITNPLSIPGIISDGAKKIGKLFDNRITSGLDSNKLLSYSMGSDSLKSGIVYNFSNIFPIPTNDQIKNGSVTAHADMSLVQSAFDSFYASIGDNVKFALVVYYYGNFTSFDWSGAANAIIKGIQTYTTLYNSLLSAYDSIDGSKMESYVKTKVTAIKACGQTVNDTTGDPATDDSKKDINYRTYSASGQPDFTKLKYWKIYSNIINTVGLLPQYWRVGLLIPTPAGIVKVPLPIIWKPLVVIPTPTTLIVVFITIDGMIVSPVIWTLTQKPVANAESKFLVLFRGANQSIKTDTGVKMLNLPIVDNQDTNPALSRTLPFAQDDIPSVERVSLTNPLLLVYVNLWLSVATPFMGIP